jgi:hypothetical protein
MAETGIDNYCGDVGGERKWINIIAQNADLN